MRQQSPFPRRRPVQPTRTVRTRLQVERLEERAVPSVNMVESEPNNTIVAAQTLPRVADIDVIVDGDISATGDRDWFRVGLQAGDVIGAALAGQSGLNPAVRLVNSSGSLLVSNDDANFVGNLLPSDSPLPGDQSHGQNAEFYYVISTPGTYFIEAAASADAGTGKYKLDLVVARPGLEKQPIGTKQILFLDFDGAAVNFSQFPTSPGITGTKQLSPLRSFLADWGLTPADENAVIDGIVTKVTAKLSAYVRANGLNGDFALTGIPGQFDIDIRNSRDNPDEFGKNPFVSRVVVGGSAAEAGFVGGLAALAQYLDPGNFNTQDDAVVTLDTFTDLLTRFRIRPPATSLDFLTEGIATAVAHEASHNFGCFHTDQLESDIFAGTPNLMDPHFSAFVGPDGVFGTADDLNLHLGVDAYRSTEPFRGVNDTLNNVAFGLSTGKASALHATAAASTTRTGILHMSQVNPLLREALRRWQAAGIDPSALHGIDVRITNLGGTTLGLAAGNTVWLDDNAAGWGWFVDKTPSDDSEFLTPGNQGEKNRMDLLTVLEHEVGHLLGYEHESTGVMIDTLSAGTRRTPGDTLASSPIGFWFSGMGKKKDSLLAAWVDDSQM